jgi:hypothetical protein
MVNFINLVAIPTTISTGATTIPNATARERPIRLQPFASQPTTTPENPA